MTLPPSPEWVVPRTLKASPLMIADYLLGQLDQAGFSCSLQYCDAGALHRSGDGMHTFMVDVTPRSRALDPQQSIEAILFKMLSLPALVIIQHGAQRYTALGIGGNPALVSFCNAYAAQSRQ